MKKASAGDLNRAMIAEADKDQASIDAAGVV